MEHVCFRCVQDKAEFFRIFCNRLAAYNIHDRGGARQSDGSQPRLERMERHDASISQEYVVGLRVDVGSGVAGDVAPQVSRNLDRGYEDSRVIALTALGLIGLVARRQRS